MRDFADRLTLLGVGGIANAEKQTAVSSFGASHTRTGRRRLGHFKPWLLACTMAAYPNWLPRSSTAT